MWPFSRKVRRQLGVDVGTSSVKVVELERADKHIKLANYGLVDGSDFFGSAVNGSNIPSGLKISENDVALVIKQLLETAKIKAEAAVMSIPVFSSFLTVMELPSLKQKELESAVPFEARSYIPVPLSEVVLDWLVIPVATSAATLVKPAEAAAGLPPAAAPSKITVLLIAVPKEVVAKYQRIAASAGLKLAALESESFSLARSLAGNDSGTVMLADMGARSSNLTILDKGYIFMSHSADLSGKEITKVIGHSLNVDASRAEELKKTSGVAAVAGEKGLAQIVVPVVDRLVGEIERMDDLFFKKESRKIEKIILTGGTANMPGVAEYLSRKLGLVVAVGNPFSRIKFDPALDQVLRRDLGSVFSVSVGLAMREL